MLDLIERRVDVAGHALTLRVPRDSEALLSEEAFADDEFLPYWAELWPSALALAEANQGDQGARPLDPLTVLELGAGLGVPAIAAALAGHRTVATDWAADAVDLLRENAARNGAPLRALRWSWTADPAPLGGPFDRVLAADVLYEARNVGQLLDALPALVAPGGEAWIADPGRTTAAPFVAAAVATWTVDRVEHAGPPSVTIHRLRRETAPRG
jgi:predicted nicotinamide N-methyase